MASDMNLQRAGMATNLFNQTLQGWKENQQAGGSLVGAGLSNLIGANRYNAELAAMKNSSGIENNWLNNTPQ